MKAIAKVTFYYKNQKYKKDEIITDEILIQKVKPFLRIIEGKVGSKQEINSDEKLLHDIEDILEVKTNENIEAETKTRSKKRRRKSKETEEN